MNQPLSAFTPDHLCGHAGRFFCGITWVEHPSIKCIILRSILKRGLMGTPSTTWWATPSLQIQAQPVRPLARLANCIDNKVGRPIAGMAHLLSLPNDANHSSTDDDVAEGPSSISFRVLVHTFISHVLEPRISPEDHNSWCSPPGWICRCSS